MHIDFRPDFPVTDASCLAATGKGLSQWFVGIEAQGFALKRREAIQWIYEQTGRGKDVWWPTTIWVEFEAARGVVKKDGRAEGYNICCTKSFKRTPAELFVHFGEEAAVNAWVTGWSGAITTGAAFTCGSCHGEVGRIRPDKDLRLTWSSPGFGPSEVEILFTAAAGKTTVNIFHKRIASRDEADGLRRAWGEALDRLKALEG